MSKLYSPLFDFHLSPNEFSQLKPINISENLSILPVNLIPELKCLSSILKSYRIHQYEQVQYWLCLETTPSSKDAEELVNLFQLALWIVKRTRVSIHFISNLKAKQVALSFYMFHSRFLYVTKGIAYEFTSQDMKQLCGVLQNLLDVFNNKSRLRNAITLNYNGCISPYWEVTYILLSTTFESLLTYKSSEDLTEKLAKSYAALISVDLSEREQHYKNFREIYRIRSDIIHGSSAFKTKYRDGNLNLVYLAKLSDMLREFWVRILDDSNTINSLAGNDNRRKNYLQKTIGYWKTKKSFWDQIRVVLKIGT